MPHGCVIAPSCHFEHVGSVARAPEWAELVGAPALVPTLAPGRSSSQAGPTPFRATNGLNRSSVRGSAMPLPGEELREFPQAGESAEKNKKVTEALQGRCAAADKTTHVESCRSLSRRTKRLGSFGPGLPFSCFYFSPQKQTLFSQSAEWDTRPVVTQQVEVQRTRMHGL